jgi:anti-sigma factor RsiW
MNCSKALEELVAYLDGELGERAAAQVKRHLELCPACRLEAEKLGATAGLLGNIADIEPSAGFTADTIRRALARPAEPSPSRLRLVRRLAPVAAAAVVLLVLGLWLAIPREPAGIEALDPVEQEIVQNMDILENLDLLEDYDILSELDLLLEYEADDFAS